MKKVLQALAATAAIAGAASADALNPGSLLVYPVQYSAFGSPMATASGVGQQSTIPQGLFTVLCVTNTNVNPSDAGTLAHFEYVNTTLGLDGKVEHCQLLDRVEYLSPADTLCVLASCHNPTFGDGGYMVLSAQDPSQFDVDWSFNHLIGSEIVIDKFGAIFTLNAIPFKAIAEEGEATDVDADDLRDFDDVEYEGIPETLYLDSFVASLNQSLVLINLTGSANHDAVVAFDIFNDNEFPLSATTTFRCWMQRCLAQEQIKWGDDDEVEFLVADLNCISPVFSQAFLENNTPDSEYELDVDCDNYNDYETGWARIRGLTSSSQAESLANPALLGATSGGLFGSGGKRLWESEAKQLNGAFLSFASVTQQSQGTDE